MARPLASSMGGAVVPETCGVVADAFFVKGMGNLPSDLRYSNGFTANIEAINRQTTVTNRLSVESMFRMLPEAIAFTTIRARKKIAAMMQRRFSSRSSLFIASRFPHLSAWVLPRAYAARPFLHSRISLTARQETRRLDRPAIGIQRGRTG